MLTRQIERDQCAAVAIAPEWASTIAQERKLDTAALLRDRSALERMIAETLATHARDRALAIVMAAREELPAVPPVRPGNVVDTAVARLVAAERARRQAAQDAQTERQIAAMEAQLHE